MTLGESLRIEREKQGLAIDTLAPEIRIKPAILRAIEADDTGHIPKVYLRGYVRSYARRLGLKPADVEVRIGAAPADEPPVQSVFSEALPRDRSERWFKASSYVLASAVVIALVWQFTTEAVRFSQGEPLPRSTSMDIPRPAGSSAAAEQQREPAPDAFESGRRETANSHLRASIASMDASRPPQQLERRSVAEGAWAAVGNRAGETDLPNAAPQGGMTLSIATSADSWVEIVDGKGQKIEMDLLRAGTRRDYRGVEPFRLLLGRASSIQLSYNGQPVDLAPHTRGNVARVVLGGEQPAPADATPKQLPPETSTLPGADQNLPDQG